VLLPAAWPLQALAGATAFLVAGRLLRVFTAADWALLRQALRSPRDADAPPAGQ
jgi:hypothetical protein